MRFWTSDYTLKYKDNDSIRQGFLIKVQFQSGLVGYSDCHPWKEFGDLGCEDQKSALKSGPLTQLLLRSLHFAREEAQARAENRSLFEGLKVPRSHFLVRHANEGGEYPVKKIKLSSTTWRKFIKEADTHTLWRIDFNASLTKEECSSFLESAKQLKIDFVEDPFPSHNGSWKELEERHGVPFAADFEEVENPSILVCKPAIKPLPNLRLRKVITSYLDHPIGQLAALYTAAKEPSLSDEWGGFISHVAYAPNPFSERLSIENHRLKPPDGIGWGMDDLLEGLSWK